MTRTFTVKACQLFENGTHTPQDFALFVFRDGYSFTDALTRRRTFKTERAALDFWESAKIAPSNTRDGYEHLVKLA